MKKLFAAIALSTLALAVPASSANEIVYLECDLISGDKNNVWKIALDESAKTITYEHEFASGTKPAVFTADNVSWSAGDMWISRVDLKIYRAFFGMYDVGQCRVAEPVKRAF